MQDDSRVSKNPTALALAALAALALLGLQNPPRLTPSWPGLMSLFYLHTTSHAGPGHSGPSQFATTVVPVLLDEHKMCLGAFSVFSGPCERKCTSWDAKPKTQRDRNCKIVYECLWHSRTGWAIPKFKKNTGEMLGQLANFSKVRHNTIPRARQNLLGMSQFVSVCLSLSQHVSVCLSLSQFVSVCLSLSQFVRVFQVVQVLSSFTNPWTCSSCSS